jgi:hypothetical protein
MDEKEKVLIDEATAASLAQEKQFACTGKTVCC